MIFLSALAKTYAFVFGPAHLGLALVCWAAGLIADIAFFRRRHSNVEGRTRVVVRDVLWMNLGAFLVGCAVQGTFAYAAMRWKEGLPGLAHLAGLMMRAAGVPATVFRGDLYLTTMAGPMNFAVSLDNLVLWLPVCMASFYGVSLLLTASTLRRVFRSLAWICGIMALVAVARLVFSAGLFLGLCDFVSYETEELPIAPFIKPATVAVMYLPFLLATWPLLTRALQGADREGAVSPIRPPLTAWLLGAALTGLFLIALWEPEGELKQGKVLINTFHTQWSRTDRPYDRDWYGADSGYNYACLKRWFEVFHDVGELKTRIQAKDLEGVSVLIVYLPDRPFSEDEKRVIVEFVRRGGGLFLIGDHTNVFGSTSHLNELCAPFGFMFRDDVLFDQEEDFFQRLDVPRLQPAFLHGMSFFKFRGAASIQPTSIFTRPVIWLDNSKSMRAIYSVNNFYPPPHDRPDMNTGRFCVSAASRFGQGRVFAFADSTVFSNFEVFYPGKYELLLNAVHWLNHGDSLFGAYLRRFSLLAAGLVLGWFLFRNQQPRQWLYALAAALLAFYLARYIGFAAEHARSNFPAPVRPARVLCFAADADDPVYALRAFTSQEPYDQRYDVFIQWVLRTGAFTGFYVLGPTHRPGLYENLCHDQKTEVGLALMVRGPKQLDALEELMRGPGAESRRLLLAFSRQLQWGAVANTLRNAGIVNRADSLERAKAAWPSGEIILEERNRRVLLLFSAERFSDQAMGFSEKVVPTDNQRALFSQEFSLVDSLFAEDAPKTK